jgi:hypothetical protein
MDIGERKYREKQTGENCLKNSFIFLLSQVFLKIFNSTRISWAERATGRIQTRNSRNPKGRMN